MTHAQGRRAFTADFFEVHEGPGRLHPHTLALEQPERGHDPLDGVDGNWEHDWIDLGGEG